MARLPELEEFAAEHGLPLISIADSSGTGARNEKLVLGFSEARSDGGRDHTAFVYESVLDGEQQPGLVLGRVDGEQKRAGAGALRVPHR